MKIAGNWCSTLLAVESDKMGQISISSCLGEDYNMNSLIILQKEYYFEGGKV